MDKQYFDIKYPFTNEGFEKFEFDLNSSPLDRVTSDLLHLLFTPKGQRLRKPDFGTDLIRFIFNPSDTKEWDSVRSSIQDTVTKWIRGVVLNDIEVMASEDGRSIYVKVMYTVSEGRNSYDRSIVVEI
jgi:phage baseplate assembly protein W